MTIRYEVSDDVAVITIDRPPVNSLNLPTRRALLAAMNQAMSDGCVRAVVISGEARTFSAGADIEEFNEGLDGPTYAAPTLVAIVDALDAASKPVVAAVAGVCLGGGLELALACHARICSADARFGLPEVKLGLLPGAGGTQRLPRLIGVAPALKLIISGSFIDARRAGDLGLAHPIDGDLLAAARTHALRLVGKALPRVSDLRAELPPGENAEHYFTTQRTELRQMLPAPLACIDAVECASTQPFAEGVRSESAMFLNLIQTPESKALRYAFFADRAAGRPPATSAGELRRKIRTVGIVGAGTMGTGIAICCLDAGLPTILMDVNPTVVAAGVEQINAHYSQMMAKGRIDSATQRERTAKLVAGENYNALSGCELVIEAVYENLATKQEVFRELDRVLLAGAVIASNTSTLDLNQIAAATRRPADVVGLHFFSPANVMRLLEIIRGGRTSASTLTAALSFGKLIGKTSVVANVCDGFIGNRMLEEYLRQAYALVDAGILPWRIDSVLERWGMAMGPFAVMDLAGGDIGWAIRKRRSVEQPDRPYSTFPDRVCELQRFGRKTRAGYYAYDARGKRTIDPLITQLATDHALSLGQLRADVTDEEIVERCVFALVNEGARLLEEGVAERASDIDVVYRHGYGFPAHRGGPMYFAESVGLDRVLSSMSKFRSGYEGWFWNPAPLLLDAVRRGDPLTGF
jgi:3-hydroxyacyl-CoA dehydrogenase